MHLPISDRHDVLSNTLDVSVGMVGGGQAGREMTAHPVGMLDGSQHVEIATGVADRRDVIYRCTQCARQTPQPHRLVAWPEVGDVAVGSQACPDEIVGAELMREPLDRKLPGYRDNGYLEAMTLQ